MRMTDREALEYVADAVAAWSKEFKSVARPQDTAKDAEAVKRVRALAKKLEN